MGNKGQQTKAICDLKLKLVWVLFSNFLKKLYILGSGSNDSLCTSAFTLFFSKRLSGLYQVLFLRPFNPYLQVISLFKTISDVYSAKGKSGMVYSAGAIGQDMVDIQWCKGP